MDISGKKKDVVKAFKKNLGTDRAWACRGILRIYGAQTSGEKDIRATVERNGVGFTGADAEILSSFAEQLRRGRTLSDRQMTVAFRKMPKYAAQLYEWAAANQAAVDASARQTPRPSGLDGRSSIGGPSND